MKKSTKEELLKTQRAILSLKQDEEYFNHLKAVEFYPHTNQRRIIKKLFGGVIKRAFLQCSRNFGKSSLSAIDMVWNAGRLPKTKNYIIAPFRSQAEEIYYQSGLIDLILPDSWRLPGEDGFNKSQLRWRLKNGSYLKLDGADNEPALRGYKPHRLVADEIQDWKRSAWIGMEPNLLAHDATAILVGTPPDIEGLYTELAQFIASKMLEHNPRFFYSKQTIYDNPLIPMERIEELRLGFLSRGEGAIWKREYLAEFVPGGAHSIFPMFSREDHVKPIEWIEARFKRYIPKLDYITVSDPSGTRHATLLVAYDKQHAGLYILDEILETDPKNLSVGQLYPRIKEKEERYYRDPNDCFRIYDEAAKLFAIEMAQFGMSYSPTSKKQNDKSNNISLVRDMMVRKKLIVAEHCTHTIEDFFNYHTNEKGKIVKEKDDCVDCVLYVVAEIGYSLQAGPINIRTEERRMHTPYEDPGTALYDESKWQPSFEDTLDLDEVEDFLWN